jgi:hypothetical protein
MQYENFWKNLFSKNKKDNKVPKVDDDKLSIFDYVRVKTWKDVGQIVSIIPKDDFIETPERFIIKFTKPRGGRGTVYTFEELEKITKEQFELDSVINKFNL